VREVEFAARPGMSHEVSYARQGYLGRVMLNRPRAINVLNDNMVTSILAQLGDWAQDDAVVAVSIQGAGEGGLCAGGDIRALRTVVMVGSGEIRALRTVVMVGSGEAVRFWAHEYQMNAAIDSYPKPFVSFMDGIVMGGGVGLSAHGSLRLVTERPRVAMPETAIGFSPDVGSLFLLSRAPGEIGAHLAGPCPGRLGRLCRGCARPARRPRQCAALAPSVIGGCRCGRARCAVHRGAPYGYGDSRCRSAMAEAGTGGECRSATTRRGRRVDRRRTTLSAVTAAALR
jgi:Enoyl-CoA hydratase/isomerase